MKQQTASTRRSFLKFGALFAAPLAAAPAIAATGDDAAAKLAKLEAMNAMRDVQGAFVRAVNAGNAAQAAALFADPKSARMDATLTHLAADPGSAEAWDMAADGKSAILRTAMLAKTATPIEGDSTILQMARLQGEGVVRATSSRTLQTAFVKTEAGWKIASATLG